MNLQDLVPPLELCRAIPKGEFSDSFFCYTWCSFRNEYLICKRGREQTQDFCYPAPTLQEILAELKGFEMIGNTCYSIMKGDLITYGRIAVESALRLWLEYKGIKTK